MTRYAQCFAFKAMVASHSWNSHFEAKDAINKDDSRSDLFLFYYHANNTKY